MVIFVWFRENPLALYVFSGNKKDVDVILKNTRAGGVAVNDTVMHAGGNIYKSMCLLSSNAL